jgi:hypothetical protein
VSTLSAWQSRGDDVEWLHACSYNNDGGDGWKRPGFLAETLDQATAMQTLAAEANVPLWCGECGPHNGGGKQGVTDRVISSFWYMDALGGLARLGLQQHGRQSLVGGHYGLLQVQRCPA